MRLALLALLLVSPVLANSVTLPAEVKVGPGRLAKLTAKTDGKQVRWINGSLDADLIASETGLWAIFSAPAPGRYLVYAYTASGDVPSEPAVCVVVVGDPGPGPPVPPTPPVPPPTPPVDPLLARVKAAWQLETDLARVTQKNALAAIYRQGAAIVRDDQTLSTWGSLFEALSTVAKAMNVTGKLLVVQKAIQIELQSVCPSDRNAPLDASGRELASKTFTRIADALEGLK